MPVSRDRAQRRLVAGLRGVQVDAIEVVAGLFRRYGKARFVDQALQVLSGQLELLAHLADADVGKILCRKRLQRKARMTGGKRQALLLRVLAYVDLTAVGQLANDVVQHMGRHGDGTRLTDVGGNALDDFALKVGRLEFERRFPHPQQDVRQDGDRRASFDDAGDVAERPQEFTTFDHKPHGRILGRVLLSCGNRPAQCEAARRPLLRGGARRDQRLAVF